jgi:methyl-accepting chemotaxis protein
VKAGARAIDQAAQHLSARSETQAATLEQSAAAITELLESVRSTSAKAGEGEAAGRSNSEQAKIGVDVVRQAIEAMQAIERSSEQMTRIISVIDDIAFETNLLALNAGVAAARAGEAGRGFAVVASEVRALAQRASESAREIKALISDSATQVARGSTLVAQTDERLSVILRRAMDVQTLMVDIAAATSEQRASREEISRGVTQLDQVTQQNAAAAEETSSSASTLSRRASALMDALAQFSTAGRGPLAAPSLATGGMLGQPARRAGGMR